MMIQRPAGRRDIRSASRTYGSRASAAVAAQRRALRMAARDTRLLGLPRMSQGYGGIRSGGELKGMDTIINNATVGFNPVLATTNTNGSSEVLNLIQTGTGSWNRIGRKTCLKSVRVKGYAECTVFQNATNDFTGNAMRVVLVWDRQPSGATVPAFDDIFSDTNQGGAETTVMWSQPAFDTLDRFRVVKDMTIQFLAENTPAATNFTRIFVPIDEYVRLPELESNYSGQSVPMTIADINNGALYLIARAQTQNAATTEFSLEAVCRLRYVD